MSALIPSTSAPDFKLPLVGGGEFSLRQALAKGPVVLVFFKISCPVCQYSLPYFGRLASKGVSVVGVSQDDEQDTARFLRTYDVGFPAARDNEHRYAVSAAYGLTNVPTAFEVGGDGKIVASIVGWSKAEVEAIYARHLDHGTKGRPTRRQSAPSGDPGMPLFKPGEEVAEFRPG
jgi:peroxiredoxin